VWHVIEGGVEVSVAGESFEMGEADTCCAPGYVSIGLRNRYADRPSFLFVADESPLHRKLGIYEVRE
jgi:gentisate 1,2-dioxygenase